MSPKKKSVCLYFQVHQPYRLRKYHFFEIGEHNEYFDKNKNREVFEKIMNKCYLRANNLILKLLKKNKQFKVSYCLSGVFLDQCEEYGPDVLKSFQELNKTGRVEFLTETYYHSLSFLFSKLEFVEQLKKHQNKIYKYFGKQPKIFRNTELIYNNELGNFIQKLGFKGILIEGADHILNGRSANYLYKVKKCNLHKEDKKIAKKYRFTRAGKPPETKLILKNYKLSDDIAFRFSNKSWQEHPLTSEKFTNWLSVTEGDTINLFMDYETFGEHQWEDTGIFDFLEHLPDKILASGMIFKTPSELADSLEAKEELDIHNLISWADLERDISAWIGNDIQESAIREIYDLEHLMRTKVVSYPKKERENMFDTWRKLQTSDQFYYMCTKYWSDGDVHKYFSPYESPYDAYITFMNILNDFKIRIT